MCGWLDMIIDSFIITVKAPGNSPEAFAVIRSDTPDFCAISIMCCRVHTLNVSTAVALRLELKRCTALPPSNGKSRQVRLAVEESRFTPLLFPRRFREI